VALNKPKEDLIKLDSESDLFKNGLICEVLNPMITHPMKTHEKAVKLGNNWISLNFYLLKTRMGGVSKQASDGTKTGQFLITLEPLTNIQNLMLHDITLSNTTSVD